MVHDLSLVNLSLILLGFLVVILGSGVWIAVGLGLVGFIAMILTPACRRSGSSSPTTCCHSRSSPTS